MNTWWDVTSHYIADHISLQSQPARPDMINSSISNWSVALERTWATKPSVLTIAVLWDATPFSLVVRHCSFVESCSMYLSSFLRVWRWLPYPPSRNINNYLPIRTYTHFFLLVSCNLAILGWVFSVLYSVITFISTSCYVKECRFVLDNCLFLAFI